MSIMHDDEIRTKPLSDWKPETDIKLQKAFGKFVEEIGELMESTELYLIRLESEYITAFENELADCDAVIAMIEHASPKVELVFQSFDEMTPSHLVGLVNSRHTFVGLLTISAGKALNIVGRCQIQGLDKADPGTGVPNITKLIQALTNLRVTMAAIVHAGKLNRERIEKRKQAKIDTKLPWVMGTSKDLLPDNSNECDPDKHNWRYTGTDPRGSHKGEDCYRCTKCPARKYENG
jgi:hypothetical protein